MNVAEFEALRVFTSEYLQFPPFVAAFRARQGQATALARRPARIPPMIGPTTGTQA